MISNSKKYIPAIVMYSMLSMLVIFFLTITYWITYPYKPIVVNSLEVITPEVYPGDYLIYEIDFTKLIDKTCKIHRQIVNDFSIFYIPVYSNAKLGRKSIKSKLQVPVSTDEGEYYLKWDAEYQVNPLRIVTVTAWSGPFYVINNPNRDCNQDKK